MSDDWYEVTLSFSVSSEDAKEAIEISERVFETKRDDVTWPQFEKVERRKE